MAFMVPRINPTDCGNPLAFHLVPLAGESFHLNSETSQFQIVWWAQNFVLPFMLSR